MAYEQLANAPRVFAFMYAATVGSEKAIARFPLVVLSQTTHSTFSSASKDLIRSYNPGIILLGYQVLSEEVDRATPGPGEAIMWALRTANPDLYMRDSVTGDDTGTITLNGSAKLYDYRKPQWQNGIIAALDAMLVDYPYDGFFLDNCTVFNAHNPTPSVRAATLTALRVFIRDVVRPRYPNLIIIGNSGDSPFEGLNGELNEDRPTDYAAELPSSSNHTLPEIKLAHRLTSSNSTFATAAASASSYGTHVFVGAGPDYNAPYWYDTHTQYLTAKTRPAKPVPVPSAGGFI